MVRFKFDTKKLEKDLNIQIQKVVEQEKLKLNFENQQEIYGMKILEPMVEEAFKIILDNYDGNNDNYVDGEYDLFPAYIKSSFFDIFMKLRLSGVITGEKRYLSGWNLYLTPNGKTYFEDKKKCLNRREEMFYKLPSNSRKLLNEILESDEPAEMLAERFEGCNSKEDSKLRAIIGELSEKGLIKVFWADDVPDYIEISNSGRTYFEKEDDYIKNQHESFGTTVNIGTLNATGSNVVVGDAINSKLSVDNSIREIEKKIDELGGADSKVLKELLEEAKDIIENIKITRQIPKNKSFFNRINEHVVKHGWFYGAVIQLLGTEAMTLLKM